MIINGLFFKKNENEKETTDTEYVESVNQSQNQPNSRIHFCQQQHLQ
mgnify:CR=1 FL=1